MAPVNTGGGNIGCHRMAVTALRWLGGKSATGTGVGRWIASQLPHTEGYVEPYGGMLGVLLQRPPAKREMVNDLNGRIVNWWRVVRDRHTELGEWLEWTAQGSREEYEWAADNLDNPDPLLAAAAFTLAVNMSLSSTDYAPPGKFSLKFGAAKRWSRDNLLPVANRLRRVDLENQPAETFVKRISGLGWSDQITIYADPPYPSTRTAKDYTTSEIVVDQMAELFTAHPGPVAISGYDNEWDITGWRTEVFETNTSMHTTISGNPPRVEKLWLNYPPL